MLHADNPRPSTYSRIRVLVVDDSVVIRKILSDALRADLEIEVVGSASNGLIALQRIAQLNPDLVTLDIEMPEMDGIATLREIKRQFPRTRVIMCSTLTERGASITIEALSLGADDYLTKSHGPTGLSALNHLHDQLIPKVKQFFTRHAGPGAVYPLHSGSPLSIAGRTSYGGATNGKVLPTASRPASNTPAKRPRTIQPRAVAIGVSTGGPNALAEVIPMLPKNFPVPVFIVQHMPPMFTRLLAERLQAQSQLKVMEAQEGMRVAPGHVYIAPGDYHMCLAKSAGGVLIRLNQEPTENSCRPAVDVLFRSVGEIYGGAIIAVILTGMGQDGLRGIEQLRALGGYVIAQDEASSVVWGMPGFVARAGLADAVCDLKQVTPEIVRHI